MNIETKDSITAPVRKQPVFSFYENHSAVPSSNGQPFCVPHVNFFVAVGVVVLCFCVVSFSHCA